MKVGLEFPDEKAAFVMELLNSLPCLKEKPLGRKAKPKDETEYLLSSPADANAKALLAAIERLERGEGQEHDLIEV